MNEELFVRSWLPNIKYIVYSDDLKRNTDFGQKNSNYENAVHGTKKFLPTKLFSYLQIC